MEDMIFNTTDNEQTEELSLREYYAILVKMCDILEEDPDNDFAVSAFTDAAWHLAKADCGDLFPNTTLFVNAAKTPEEGTIITSVVEVE